MDDENHIEIEVAVSGTEEAAQKVDALTASVAKAKQTTANPMAMPESMLGLPKPEVIDHTAEKIKILDGDVKALASSEQSVEAALKKVETASKDAGEAGVKAAQDTAAAAKKAAEAVEKQAKAAEAGNNRATPGKDISAEASAGFYGKLAKHAGYGKEFSALNSVLSADAAIIAGSVGAIAASLVVAYKALDGTVERFDNLKRVAAEAGETLGPELEARLEGLRATMAPVKTVIDSVGSALSSIWKIAKDPIGEISGANDLEASLRRQAEQAAKLLTARQKLADDHQAGVAETYGRELTALNDQEATLRRITALRTELASLEVQGARQEIESARLRGGDVELAQANALAVELKTGLAKLGDNLAASKQDAVAAGRKFDAASAAFQTAIRDGLDRLDPKKFKALSDAWDEKEKTLAEANQAVADQTRIFSASKTNLLHTVEDSLAKLDKESKGVSKDAADKARTSIYQTIQKEFQTTASAAIDKITADSQKIVDATTAKTTEIGTQMDAAKTATVGAVEKISSNATQHAAAIDSSVSLASAQVKEALDLQTERILTALGKVAAACVENANRAKLADRRIDQLLARR